MVVVHLVVMNSPVLNMTWRGYRDKITYYKWVGNVQGLTLWSCLTAILREGRTLSTSCLHCSGSILTSITLSRSAPSSTTCTKNVLLCQWLQKNVFVFFVCLFIYTTNKQETSIKQKTRENNKDTSNKQQINKTKANNTTNKQKHTKNKQANNKRKQKTNSKQTRNK